MSYYEKNITLVLQKDPQAKSKLSIEPDRNLILAKTKSGPPTGIYNEVYLHSRFDPVREADKLIEKECPDDISVCLFYGFGLGYQIESFLRHCPGIPVIVIEPDTAFFLKVLEARNFALLLSNPRLSLAIGWEPEAIPAILNTSSFARPKIIRLRSVYQKDKEYYERVDGILQAHITRKKINLNTLNRFGKLWVRNLIKNITLLAVTPGISQLENLFAGFPAIILASGPSLDLIIPSLRELKERFLIIAVDTSLSICHAKGVEPDFVVVVDPQYWNTRHIDRAAPRKTIMVSESSTHPRVFQILNLPVFFSSSFFPLGQFFESILGARGKLGAGGSVATSAWDLARLLGCGRIFMAGLDLGFPGKMTHFKGAFFENRFHAESGRFQTAESMSWVYVLEADPFLVASNSKDYVLTDRRMIIYKWWFENQLKNHPDARTENLSPEGVRIEGMHPVNPDILLGFPIIREDLAGRLERATSLVERERDSVASDKLCSALDELITELENLKELAAAALNQTEQLAGQDRSKKSSEILARLDELDTKILEIGSRQVVVFLFQNLIHRIMDEKPESVEQALATSREFYTEIIDSCDYHLRLLEKFLREGKGNPLFDKPK